MRVGLIGLGNMGRGLGKNFMDGGHTLTVHDINTEAMLAMEEMGATTSRSVAGLVDNSDVIVTCLPSLSSIRDVYLGPDGIVAAADQSKIAVDCSTSTPALTREIGEQLGVKGVPLLDAPMLRTPKHAWEGTIQLVVGGGSEALERARPALESVSEKIIPAGELGNGQMIKLINNAMTHGTHAVVSEAFTVAAKLNVDLGTMLEVADATNASSAKLRELAPRIINDDHTLTFAVDVAQKDIAAFAEIAVQNGARVPIAEAARDLLRLTSALGYGSENTSRTATVLARIADAQLPTTKKP